MTKSRNELILMFKRSLEDEAIIEAIRMGSEKILYSVYDNLKAEFISWFVKNHKISNGDAKDIFQDSIIAFHNNVIDEKFNATDASIKTYLFSIGRNKVLNHFKRNREIPLEDISLQSDSQISESNVDDRIEIIKKSILSLDSKCREVLIMFYEKGFSMESIANNMGYASENVAKKKKFLCMRKLEDKINLIISHERG